MSKLKKAIKDYAARQGRRCHHCGRYIREKKYSNVSHRYGKNSHPDKKYDPAHFDLLCSNLDVYGTSNPSCHHIRDFGTNKQWEAVRDSQAPMNNKLKRRYP